MSVEFQILRAAEEAQSLLESLYRKNPQPPPGSPLAQAGLRDGSSVVRDYLDHGEAGLAFEHLLYMVVEPGLRLSEESRRLIREVGEVLGFPPERLLGALRPNKVLQRTGE